MNAIEFTTELSGSAQITLPAETLAQLPKAGRARVLILTETNGYQANGNGQNGTGHATAATALDETRRRYTIEEILARFPENYYDAERCEAMIRDVEAGRGENSSAARPKGLH